MPTQDELSAAAQFPQQGLMYEQPHETSSIYAIASIQNVNYFISTATVEMNAHGATDSADITIALKNAPDITVMLARGGEIPAASAGNFSQVPVVIYIGVFQGRPVAVNSIAGMVQIFSGQVDVYSIVYEEDSVSFHCRSLAAPLVDNRITGLPRNMTTTQFVTNIAAQYGLTPSILVPQGFTPFTVAEVYQHDFAVGIQNDRIWDALIRFSNVDDTDVWVSGSTLYYASPALIPRNLIDLKYGRDLAKLRVQHSPLFSKNIRVEVRIYSPRTKQSSIARTQSSTDPVLAPGLGGSKTTLSSKTVTSTPEFGTPNSTTQTISSSGAQTTTQTNVTGGAQQSVAQQGSNNAVGPERYIIYKPGISLEMANQLAQATWRKISMQEYVATIVMPTWRSKLPLISITSKIRLHGLPTQMPDNQEYWPRRITWNIDIEAGSSVTFECVNHMLPQGAV